jgi:hypothetical protein
MSEESTTRDLAERWRRSFTAFNKVSREAVPISGVQLSGDRLRLYVSADADIPEVQRAVAAKLNAFSAKSSERQREIQRQAEEMEARRRRAEDAAADTQARFRQPPPQLSGLAGSFSPTSASLPAAPAAGAKTDYRQLAATSGGTDARVGRPQPVERNSCKCPNPA